MKKPVVDLSACNLCGSCEAACPQVFQIGDLDYLEVAEMREYPQTCVDEAIKYCPEDCIVWEDD